MKSQRILLIVLFLFSLALLPFTTLAQEQSKEAEANIFGFELDKVLNLGSGILAAVLCIITALAYQRSSNKRLYYVSLAFGLFALKGFLLAHELVFAEWLWVDPLTSVLDFVILLTFFFGIVKTNYAL